MKQIISVMVSGPFFFSFFPSAQVSFQVETLSLVFVYERRCTLESERVGGQNRSIVDRVFDLLLRFFVLLRSV